MPKKILTLIKDTAFSLIPGKITYDALQNLYLYQSNEALYKRHSEEKTLLPTTLAEYPSLQKENRRQHLKVLIQAGTFDVYTSTINHLPLVISLLSQSFIPLLGYALTIPFSKNRIDALREGNEDKKNLEEKTDCLKTHLRGELQPGNLSIGPENAGQAALSFTNEDGALSVSDQGLEDKINST